MRHWGAFRSKEVGFRPVGESGKRSFGALSSWGQRGRWSVCMPRDRILRMLHRLIGLGF